MTTKILTATLLTALMCCSCETKDHFEQRFVASDTPLSALYTQDDESLVVSDSVARGTEVTANLAKTQKQDDVRFVQIKHSGKRYYIPEGSLCVERRQAVTEKSRFVRTPTSIISDTLTSAVAGLAGKAAEVEITGYDTLFADGTVCRYLISYKGQKGYIFARYTTASHAEASANYRADKYDAVHSAVKNKFGGGEAIGCDFYPVSKPHFAHNPMPKACYALYLNISPAVLSNIEQYIALAKRTRINSFVIDIKDNECPGYKADAMKRYSPTNYKYAGDKEKLYRHVVERLHAEGFYVIGRITCFKDSYFVKDHPDCAITAKADGLPFKHNKAYWPSGYDRRVWQFNVELAKEAVRKFGFNEINFDYVRFPDRMTSVENLIDYHNRYGESKVQAVQRFVRYACDELHRLGVYVSIDVFGESANNGYTTAYGQYWPALSNIADVMCGMPYPDHFSNHYYGINEPWNHPYEILNAWGRRVQDRQSETPTPAKVRTWVQAYNVMRHVDPNGIAYDAENVEREIRGLYEAGLTGGYMTWMSSSSLEKYNRQAGAFSIDYYKEYSK